MSITWMYVISHVCQASRLAVHLARQKTPIIVHYTHSFQPNSFIPAMLICRIDFYHFIPLSLTLTFPGRHKGHNAKPIGFIFLHTFQLIRIIFDMVLKLFKLNILILFSSEVLQNEGNNYWLHKKKCSIGMHLDIYESICFELDKMIDTIELYIFILIYLTLALIQGHGSVRKEKLLYQLYHTIFNQFGWKFVYCWDLLGDGLHAELGWWTSCWAGVMDFMLSWGDELHAQLGWWTSCSAGVMNFMLSLFRPFNISRERTLHM